MASVATWIFLPGASMRSTCRRRKKYPASCVLPPNDIPGQRKLGAIVPDHPPIIDKEIAYRGDVVAVVAAETYEAACIAVDKIKITYTPWEPITSPEEAMKPGARLIHSELDSNIINRHHTAKGDIEAGFAASSHIFEREYEVGFGSTAILSRNRLPPIWTIMNRS